MVTSALRLRYEYDTTTMRGGDEEATISLQHAIQHSMKNREITSSSSCSSVSITVCRSLLLASYRCRIVPYRTCDHSIRGEVAHAKSCPCQDGQSQCYGHRKIMSSSCDCRFFQTSYNPTATVAYAVTYLETPYGVREKSPDHIV